jgi:hypothetical protein
MATVTAGAVVVKLTEALASVLLSRVNKRAGKMDVLKATMTEVAGQLIGLEARIARLEQFTKLLDLDQDNIPDAIEALIESRQKDAKNSGLQLR